MRRFATPVWLMAIGLLWLLYELDLLPVGRLKWSLLLAAIGLVTLIDQGVNKRSWPTGMGFLLAALIHALWVFEWFRFALQFPLWLMGFGLLLAMNRTGLIPDAPVPVRRAGTVEH
ncbi:hypothetical protein [Leeia sp.]|uniref:hypothetical protein n=1 Tax=Leeia sp. TaxID=2884678 RepID=UPI0035B1157F